MGRDTVSKCLTSDARPTASCGKPETTAAAAATTAAAATAAAAARAPLARQQRAQQPGGQRDPAGRVHNNFSLVTSPVPLIKVRATMEVPGRA